MAQALLLTGPPGSGKTTLIRHTLAQYGGRAGGFYTQDVRFKGQRVAFELVTLDGRIATLAHRNLQSPQRVGAYGVDLNVVDTLAVDALQEAVASKDLVVIDEIGPMEILSQIFCQTVLDALNSDKPVLGTIVQHRQYFADQIKKRKDVMVLEVSRRQADAHLAHLLGWLRQLKGEE